MSKTIASVLAVGLAVAVNVIPGVGQLLSAGLLNVGLGIGTAVSIGTAIPGVVTAIGVAAGLNLAGSMLFAPPARRPDTTESSRKSPIPSRVRAYGQLRLYGSWILYSYKSDGAPVDVWAFHDGPASAVTQVYLNDDKVTITGGVVQQLTDKRYRDGKVLAGYNLGAATETAHAAVIAALPGIWTTDHRGDGVVTGYLIKQLTKSDKFFETYPNGDDIQMSLAGQWTPVFDFRDGGQSAATPAGWEYRDSPLLAFLHFLMTQRGYDYTTQIVPQLAKWTIAANDCDLGSPLKAGGTEPRYRLALAYNANEQPSSIVSAILQTFDGWYCENERGEVVVYSGRYYEPTVDLGQAQIVSYTFQRHVASEDAVNEVTISYVSAEHDYNTVDAQSWRDQAAIDASGREPVTSPLEAQVPSASQARRLAKRKMIRANAPCRGSVVTTYGGRAALGERYINLRLEEAGTVFFDGPAEIVGSPERDMQTGGVRFDWIAADPNIDDWDPEEEEGDATPVGENPELEPLETPEIEEVVVNTETDSGSGTTGSRLYISAAGPDRDDLTWFAGWRVVGEDSWIDREYSDVDAGIPVLLITEFVPTNASLEVTVFYGAGDGRTSERSTPVTVGTVAPFDFNGTALPAETALTRASTARYYGSAGQLLTAAIDVARFDRTSTTGALRGLLIEPAATNLVPSGTDPTVWSATSFGVSFTGSQADPAGGTAAALITATGATTHLVGSSNSAVTNALTYTGSLFAKAGGAQRIQLFFRASGFDATHYANFLMSGAGSVTATNGCTATIEQLAGGWYRIAITLAANATVSDTRLTAAFINSGTAGRNPSFTPTTESWTIYGLQIEAGSRATSHIPTPSASTASRSADVATLNWTTRGVADGSYTLRYTFDDGSTQDVSTTIATSISTIPTNLNRPWIKKVAKI